MLISYQHQFLFVHIPKAAGMSVDAVLKPYAESPELLPRNRWLMWLGLRGIYWGPYRQKRFRRHDPIGRMQRNIPAAEFERLFKFSFVRNPWDRLVSLFHFRQQKPRRADRLRRYQKMTFTDFVRYELCYKRCGPQADMLCDRQGRMLADFVGRFERLHDDFGEIAARLGLAVQLPHRNASRHEDYRDYYTPETRQLVADHWRRDVELFDYDFHGHSAAAAA